MPTTDDIWLALFGSDGGQSGQKVRDMAAVLRLALKGKRHKPFYHIVATAKRSANGGKFLEKVGFYNPLGETELGIDEALAQKWLASGAKPSDRVASLLKRAGIKAGKTAAAAPLATGDA